MSDKNATGRKTGFEQRIDALMELMIDGARIALARANKIEADGDEHTMKRAAEVSHAVRLGSVGAQLATAGSKVSRKFDHSINVHRSEGRPKMTDEQYEQLRSERQPFVVPTSSCHPPLDRGLKAWHAEQEELAREDDETRAAEAGNGVPPHEGDPPYGW